MVKVRVLLVDDHTVVRRGLRKILESTKTIEVIGEVGDGLGAVEASTSLQPDVVLMDVTLPVMNGIEATRRICETMPHSRVLMLSMHADDQYVHESMAAGAKGYLLKDAADQDLIAAIMAVCRGESGFTDMQLAGPRGLGAPAADALSPREREVLTRICSGRTNRQVAEDLGVSVNTVETHRKHIIDKLDLHSTAELVRYAIRHGIVNRSGVGR